MIQARPRLQVVKGEHAYCALGQRLSPPPQDGPGHNGSHRHGFPAITPEGASRSCHLQGAHFPPMRNGRSFWMLDPGNPEVFRVVLESLEMGVCLVDRDRKITYWNDGAEK